MVELLKGHDFMAGRTLIISFLKKIHAEPVISSASQFLFFEYPHFGVHHCSEPQEKSS